MTAEGGRPDIVSFVLESCMEAESHQFNFSVGMCVAVTALVLAFKILQ
jgi:hypothetical protein